MKKIPTLFHRIFDGNGIKETINQVEPGLEWVLSGEGIATVKYDGSCCAIINGEFYRRYDAKRGKPVPKGAIKCQETADPATGHLPCWVKVDRDAPGDKWLREAMKNYDGKLTGGTYEAIGPHFQTNPYHLDMDTLIRHGKDIIDVQRSFNGIRDYLQDHNIEGIVFWKDNEPKCKIKRTDFGFKWPE